jgi:hypothetical protein
MARNLLCGLPAGWCSDGTQGDLDALILGDVAKVRSAMTRQLSDTLEVLERPGAADGGVVAFP